MSTDIDIAWAAGLFEGEGSIIHTVYLAPRHGKTTRRRLSLEMKDEDTVRRFAAIVDGGSVRVSKRVNRVNRENHSTIHIWACERWTDTERILLLLLPYLGERRSAKARELLADPAGPVGRPRRHTATGSSLF